MLTRNLFLKKIIIISAFGFNVCYFVWGFLWSGSDIINASWQKWAHWGVFELTALSFLAMGSLIWYCAKQQSLANHLFGLCVCVMILFISVITKTSTTIWPELLKNYATIIGGWCLATFLLHFPEPEQNTLLSRWFTVIISAATLFDLSIASIIPLLPLYATESTLIRALYTFPIVIMTLLCIIRISHQFLQASTQKRKQYLILFSGLIVAVSTTILATIIPTMFGLPIGLTRDITGMSFAFAPLTFGFAVIHYQIIIMDTLLLRHIHWIIWIFTLIFLMYIDAFLLHLWPSQIQQLPWFQVLLLATVVIGIVLYPGAKKLSDFLYFQHHASWSPPYPSLESTLPESDVIRHALIAEVTTLLGTLQVLLYITNNQDGNYHVDTRSLTSHQRFLLDSLQQQAPYLGSTITQESEVIHHLYQNRSPLFLHQIVKGQKQSMVVSSLPPHALHQPDCLLVPLIIYQKMVGILVLGSRGEEKPYIHSDFVKLHHLEKKYTLKLYMSLFRQQTHQHHHLIMQLYAKHPQLELPADIRQHGHRWMKDIVCHYAAQAAQAIEGHVELWLTRSDQSLSIYREAQTGAPPGLLPEMLSLTEDDWIPQFTSTSHGHAPTPMVVSTISSWDPLQAFARIPLYSLNHKPLGMLFLFFPGAHRFSPQEQHIFSVYAQHCASAIEQAQQILSLANIVSLEQLRRVQTTQYLRLLSRDLPHSYQRIHSYLESIYHHITSGQRSRLLEHCIQGTDFFLWKIGQILEATRTSDELKESPTSLFLAVQQAVNRYHQANPLATLPHIEVSTTETILVDETRFIYALTQFLLWIGSPQWSLTLSSYQQPQASKLTMVIHFHPGKQLPSFSFLTQLLQDIQCNLRVDNLSGTALLDIPLA